MPETEIKSAAYQEGYRHGSDSTLPDTRGFFGPAERQDYFDGYAQGSQARDLRLYSGQGHVPRPDWMTDEQFEAVNKLYHRSPDGARDRHEFFSRVQLGGVASDNWAVVPWCGMFMGIEKDGYTHS